MPYSMYLIVDTNKHIDIVKARKELLEGNISLC